MSEHLEVNRGRKSLWMESTFYGHSVLIIFQLPKADCEAVSRKLSLISRNEAAFYPMSKLSLRMEAPSPAPRV